jgi:hypothetical protein
MAPAEMLGLYFYSADVIFVNLESKLEIRDRYARKKSKSKNRGNAWQSIQKPGRYTTVWLPARVERASDAAVVGLLLLII